MDATQWDCELVTDTAPERIRLDESKVMRVRRVPAAHQAWLPGDELSVLLISKADRFAQGRDGRFVRRFTGFRRNFLASRRISPPGGHYERRQYWMS
jgi:hypothetical protein